MNKKQIVHSNHAGVVATVVGGELRLMVSPNVIMVMYDGGWPASRPDSEHILIVGGEGESDPPWMTQADVRLNPESGSTPPSETTLAGVGSASTSLTDYPKTGPVTTGDYFVDPKAGANGIGTEGDPFNDLGSALSAVSDGQRILVKSGTIVLSSNLYRNTGWVTGIQIWNYGTDRPVINAQNLATGNAGIALMLDNDSAREHWKGFEIINAPDMGVDIKGVNHTIEDVRVHHCMASASDAGRAGIRSIGSGARNNMIQDCAVWRLGDGATTTSNAPDCYQITATTGNVQTGTKLVRCFGAHAQDDVFDTFRGNGVHVIDCVAYRAGYYWNGISGSSGGSGFKMGGADAGVGDNLLRGSIAVDCRSEAVKPNSSPLGSEFRSTTVVGSTNVGWNLHNASDPGEIHVARDNVAHDNAADHVSDPQYVDSAFNTWDLSIANPAFADVSAHDYSLASGSACIGAGEAGGNLGASEVALKIAKEWLAKDLT